MKKIVFLVSGNGGNLKFFYLAKQYKYLNNVQLFVIADRECGAVKFARKNKLDSYIVNYKLSDTKTLNDILDRISSDIIVTNWYKIIDELTVRKFKGKLINLHYSLLPAFAGLIGVEPIKRAYDQGCRYIGPTCHFVDEGVDSGKIVAQAIICTDIAQNVAIDLMFRKGCLVLLNGVCKVIGDHILGDHILGEIKFPNESLFFSPALAFDEAVFCEVFWRELANL